jgi:hypothetical protein
MDSAVFVGPDEAGLATALEDAGVGVTHVADTATRPALEEAGAVEADLLVVTDVGQGTAVPIARDLNEDLRVLLYTGDGLPEYLSAMAVTKMDPRLLGPAAVTEELLREE